MSDRLSDRPQRHVLLVEDSPLNRKLLVYMLKNEGFDVVLAMDGQEALQKVKQQTFDLIIMDIQMPVMDGLEATRLIREFERESGRHTPIVAVTAAMDRSSCMNAGADEYIEKPVGVRVFHDVLSRVCESS